VVTIVIAVVIAVSTDHHGIVAIPRLALANHFTVAIAIAMTVADGNANTRRANSNADFFRARRHRNRYSGYRDGSHYKTLDHRICSSLNELSTGQLAQI
jgi:hypothetical protein